MNIHAVSSYLLSFDVEAQPPAMEDDFPAPPMETGEPAQDERRSIPDAEIESLKTQYAQDLAEALERQGEMHVKALEDARDRWALQISNNIAESVCESIESCFSALRADLARALAPFVSREIREGAVSDLIGKLEPLLADDETPSLRIEGPKDILESVARSLAEKRHLAIELAEKDVVDIRLDFGATRLESRIGDWIDGLAQGRDSEI